MEKKARVYVTNITDGEEQGIAYFAQADVEFFGEEVIIVYDEDESTGLGATRTRISVGNGVVSINRNGEVGGDMVFRQGESYEALMKTSYGTMSFILQPLFVNTVIDENKISIELDYEMQVSEGQTLYNKVNVICEM